MQYGKHPRLTLVAWVTVTLLLTAGPVWATQEVCPDPKITSQVDGDLNGIVLAAGTKVCVKGATDLMWATADGQQTLFDILGNGHDVSHYHIAVTPPTTTPTTVPDSTTTTVPDTTTTTVPDSTTTTVPDSTTSTSEATTTTTVPATTSTTDPGVVTTTTLVDNPPTLPYTGADITLLALAGAALFTVGSVLVRRAYG